VKLAAIVTAVSSAPDRESGLAAAELQARANRKLSPKFLQRHKEGNSPSRQPPETSGPMESDACGYGRHS
jgi:hypothetical protein